MNADPSKRTASSFIEATCPRPLGARQRNLRQLAVAQGCYDVPCRAGQTDLASEIGVSKATVSEDLMRVAKNVTASSIRRIAPGRTAHLADSRLA